MTAQILLERVESSGVRLSIRGRALVVTGRPNATAKRLIRDYRATLISALGGLDFELPIPQTDSFLRSIGCVQIGNPPRWTHPLGDDHMDALLFDLILDQAEAEARHRAERGARELDGMQHGGLQRMLIEGAMSFPRWRQR